jgi:hypothetical protein
MYTRGNSALVDVEKYQEKSEQVFGRDFVIPRQGPAIQTTGRSEFEDGLGSGDYVSDYSNRMTAHWTENEKKRSFVFFSLFDLGK